MKKFTFMSSGFVAIAVAMALLATNAKQAHGEIVFDEEVNTAEETEVAAEPMQQPAEKNEAEVLRRSRVREELKNESLLSKKLEELRLKDEMKRTEQILSDKQTSKEEKIQTEEIKPAVAAAPVVQEKETYQTVIQKDVAEIDKESGTSESTIKRVYITPRFGISGITNSIYDIQSEYAGGFGIGFDLGDVIAIEGGYTYSNYSINAGTAVYSPYGYPSSAMQQLQLNDNQIDLGARINFAGLKSKVRPFVTAGAGYRRGFVNYDERTQQYLSQYYPVNSQDVEISGFNGYLGTGAELRITDNVSITGMFKFYKMLTARQTNPINPNAFANPTQNGLYYNGYYAANSYGPYSYTNDAGKTQVGDALVRENFYQLNVGLTIGF